MILGLAAANRALESLSTNRQIHRWFWSLVTSLILKNSNDLRAKIKYHDIYI